MLPDFPFWQQTNKKPQPIKGEDEIHCLFYDRNKHTV
jgi:hypothetical protein